MLYYHISVEAGDQGRVLEEQSDTDELQINVFFGGELFWMFQLYAIGVFNVDPRGPRMSRVDYDLEEVKEHDLTVVGGPSTEQAGTPSGNLVPSQSSNAPSTNRLATEDLMDGTSEHLMAPCTCNDPATCICRQTPH